MPKTQLGIVKMMGRQAEMALHQRQWPTQLVVGNFTMPGGGVWFIRSASAKIMRGNDQLASWNDGNDTPLRMIKVEEGDQLTVLANGESSIASQYPPSTTGLPTAGITGTPSWMQNGWIAVTPSARNGQSASQYLAWMPPINYFEGVWTDPETTSLGTKCLGNEKLFTRTPLPYLRKGSFAADQAVPRANAATYASITAPAAERNIWFQVTTRNGLQYRPVWVCIIIGALGGTWTNAMAPTNVARGNITKAIILQMNTDENNPLYHIAVSLPDLNATDQIGITMIENNAVATGAVWGAYAGIFEGAPTDMSEYLGNKARFT